MTSVNSFFNTSNNSLTFTPANPNNIAIVGIYLCTPFCKTCCICCDFYSTTYGELKTRYVQALHQELTMRKGYLKGENIEAVYFGGGTPSQLEKKDLGLIFDTIWKHYGLNHCQEITLETNPDDLSQEHLETLSPLPFDRLSMGIQTFDDTMPRLLRHRHDVCTAIEVTDRRRKADFQSISIDLVYRSSGETEKRWENDLRQAISLNVEHISTYHLIYEEGAPIYNILRRYQTSGVNEDFSSKFLISLIEHLQKAESEYYEISNSCHPEKYFCHDTSYWKGIAYLGCGPSAHSFDGMTWEWNVPSIDTYIESIEESSRAFEIEYLDQTTCYNELIITIIRTVWGIPIEKLKQMFGDEVWEYYQKMAAPYLENGKLGEHNGALRLTHEDIFIFDSIMSDLLWVG